MDNNYFSFLCCVLSFLQAEQLLILIRLARLYCSDCFYFTSFLQFFFCLLYYFIFIFAWLFYHLFTNFTTIYYPSLIFSSSSSSATSWNSASLDSTHNVVILIVEVVVMLPLMPVQFRLLPCSSDRRVYCVVSRCYPDDSWLFHFEVGSCWQRAVKKVDDVLFSGS